MLSFRKTMHTCLLIFFSINFAFGQNNTPSFFVLPDTGLTVTMAAHNWKAFEKRNPNNIREFRWSFGDSGTLTYTDYRKSIKHTYSSQGWYKVSLVIDEKLPNGQVINSSTYSNYFPIGFMVNGNCQAYLDVPDTLYGHNITYGDNSAAYYLPNSATGWQHSAYTLNGKFRLYGIWDSSMIPRHRADYSVWLADTGSQEICLVRQYDQTNGNDTILCESRDCKSVYVKPEYYVSATMNYSYDSSLNEFNLSAQGTTPGNMPGHYKEEYSWLFNYDKLASGQQVNYRPFYPGDKPIQLNYLIRDTITDSIVAMARIEDTLSVQQANACYAGFKFQKAAVINNMTTVRFAGDYANLYSRNTYSSLWWDLGNGDTASSINPESDYAAGQYFVRMAHTVYDSTNTTIVCTDTVQKLITIVPPSHCAASFSVNRAASSAFSMVVANNSLPAHNDSNFRVSYSWDFGDGNTSTTAFPQHTYSQSQGYTLCLTLNALNLVTGQSCTSTFCDSIGVDSLGNIIFKNGQGFNINIVDPNTISVQEQNISPSWSVFPNPADDVLRFSGVDFSEGELMISILDLQGRPIKSVAINQDESLSLSGLKRGLYLIQLSQGEAVVYKKVMVE